MSTVPHSGAPHEHGGREREAEPAADPYADFDAGLDAGLDPDPDHEPEGGRRGRRRARRGGLALGLLVLVAAGTGTGYWLTGQDATADETEEAAGPAATAEVTRQTLAATESFGGTLGHGEPHTVSTAGQGTITGLPEADSAIGRGDELFRLDEEPVTALFGSVPMYRDLAVGDTGVDVRQLENNLVELGYTGFTADDEFTAETEDAVRAWQEDVGAAGTGTVPGSSVVFVPRGARVDALHAEVGGAVAPGTPVLDFTGSDQIVSLEVDMDDRDVLPIDGPVTVELPDGQEVAGVVAAVDVAPAEADPAAGGAAEAGAADAVAEVEVRLDQPVDESLLGGPVDVVAEVDERADVLVVPVSALLARSGGGYGVEAVAADGTTEVVPVDTGLFANGYVEIEGEGVDVGTVVGVAGR
ncbi:peptidoglycan-binding domain-containing protein [Streptomyces sp. B6B3]|uniref:peptidoglycan-binding domain-containing protein n=1 Tax=Streptomyces sp. B6B3 TaxID=3153570 RepID=UPI00325DF9AF